MAGRREGRQAGGGGEAERPLIGVVTHRARLTVNEAIRAERKKAGEIRGPDIQATILEPMQWTRAQTRSVVSYADHGGDNGEFGALVVRFRRDYRSIGVARGENGRVTGIDEANARIILEVAGRRVYWTPAKTSQVEVYRSAERSIGAGDWTMMTREQAGAANKSRWITRQRQALTIYANDVGTLSGAIRKELQKTSAMEGMREIPRVEPTLARPGDREPGAGRRSRWTAGRGLGDGTKETTQGKQDVQRQMKRRTRSIER
jgi:hypothetical protein